MKSPVAQNRAPADPHVVGPAKPSAPPNSGRPNKQALIEKREALLVRLIVASTRLAQSRVQMATVPARIEANCRECGAKGALSVHGAHCRTGEVLSVIAALQTLPSAAQAEDRAVG